MNSTEPVDAARTSIEDFFDAVLMPLSESRRHSGPTAMPLAADAALPSYWTALPGQHLVLADFLRPSCLDSTELAAALAEHWRAVGQDDLAPLAAQLVPLAQALRASDAMPDEPSAFIYTMF